MNELLQQALEALELSTPLPGYESKWSATVNAIYAALPYGVTAAHPFTAKQKGLVAGDGQPCPNDHDPDCRYPDCNCRRPWALGVPASQAPAGCRHPGECEFLSSSNCPRCAGGVDSVDGGKTNG